MAPIDRSLTGFSRLHLDQGAAGAPFSHDQTLVGISLLICLACSYVYLDLAGHSRGRKGLAGVGWRAGAGALLGFGIWATHTMGLLAFQSPVAYGLRWSFALAAAVVAIGCATLALLAAGRRPSALRTFTTGSLIGLGLIASLYWGLFGLRLEGALSFRAEWALGAAVACVLTSGALVVAGLRLHTTVRRILAAFPIAALIAGLHYLSVAAVMITPAPSFVPLGPAPDAGMAVMTLVLGCAAVIAVALVAMEVDSRRGTGPAQPPAATPVSSSAAPGASSAQLSASATAAGQAAPPTETAVQAVIALAPPSGHAPHLVRIPGLERAGTGEAVVALPRLTPSHPEPDAAQTPIAAPTTAAEAAPASATALGPQDQPDADLGDQGSSQAPERLPAT